MRHASTKLGSMIRQTRHSRSELESEALAALDDARAMPPGPERCEAMKKAGLLRRAADGDRVFAPIKLEPVGWSNRRAQNNAPAYRAAARPNLRRASAGVCSRLWMSACRLHRKSRSRPSSTTSSPDNTDRPMEVEGRCEFRTNGG
jgi:hypothetical protein